MDAEHLRQSEFDAHHTNGTLRIAFVGMSNAGKSYRSKVLRNDCGFYWYDVDGQIQKELGFADMGDISTWLGYPNSPTYKEHEATYLQAEGRATKVDSLDTAGKNLVFDTTGSVIYLAPDVQHWLKNECLVVHIDVGDTTIDTMLEKFLKEPKPVIWSDYFVQEANESEQDTIRRCYPKLLRNRLERYRSFAHINIPAEALHDKNGEETLDIIKSYLPQ